MNTELDLAYNKKERKCSNMIKHTKIFNFDYVKKGGIKEHNPNFPQIPDHPCKILRVGGFPSWKPNSLLILISHQPNIVKIYL